MINRETHKARITANPLTNTAGICTIERSPAKVAWRAVYVYHLSPDENGNQHNVFLDCLDETGAWAPGSALRIAYTWEGRRDNEPAPPRPFEKRPPEPRAQLDINPRQIITCWVDDVFTESDRVTGLRSDVQDVPNNSRFHNSFVVLFQKQWGEVVIPPDPPTEPADCPDLRVEVGALRALVVTQGKTIEAMMGVVVAIEKKLETWTGD
jgi:hypothetical protein